MSEQTPEKACDRSDGQTASQSDIRIDKVLSLLGHELRNPIAAISMGAEALARMCAGNRDQLTIVDVIRRQSQQTGRLLEELLDLARVRSRRLQTHVERFDVIDRLRKAVTERGGQGAAPRLNVDLRLPPGPAFVRGDAARITQAIGQLIDHLVAAEPRDPIIIAAVISSAECITIEIGRLATSDEGPELKDFFEPFHEGTLASGGLTVSVALAKGLMELFGGSIEARGYKAGKATSFRVSLPLVDQSLREANSGGAEPPVGARRVLIIDDSPDVVMSLEFLLQQSGHETTSAVDGAQGIESAKRSRPDVVVCDIGLPGIDGYEVARQLRADPQTAAIYLIAVSGYAGEEDEQRSLASGFDLHLNKPQGFIGLADLLHKLPLSSRLAQ